MEQRVGSHVQDCDPQSQWCQCRYCGATDAQIEDGKRCLWYRETCTSLHVWWLRKRARVWYKRMYALRDSYDCGEELMYQLSATARRIRDKFNAIAEKLDKIDPTFPKGWRI